MLLGPYIMWLAVILKYLLMQSTSTSHTDCIVNAKKYSDINILLLATDEDW